MKTYELKIGYSDINRTDRTIRTEYIQAKSLNAAKTIATNKMKSLPEMKKYLTDRHGRSIVWAVWSKEQEHAGSFYVSKKSKQIHDDKKTFGYIQLSWDNSQLTLFGGNNGSNFQETTTYPDKV